MAGEQDKNTQIDETAAADSLHPQTKPIDDPRTKVEALAKMIGAANAMTSDELCKWANEMLAQYPAASFKGAPQDAEGNKATQKMHPSDAQGGTAGAIAPMPLVKIAKEDVESLFAGETLTEEAQAKITTLFEAAVTARVGVAVAELEEQYETKLTESVQAFIDETSANLDDYIQYAAETWLKDNEVAVVDSLRTENAEEFMNNLRDLFVESYFDVPEDRLDVLGEMSEKLEALEKKLDEAIGENVELKRAQALAERAAIVTKVTEGLTMVDANRIKKLIENVEFKDATSFEKNAKLVVETYGKSAKKPVSEKSGSVELIDEGAPPPEAGKKEVSSDPFVTAAARMLDRTPIF